MQLFYLLEPGNFTSNKKCKFTSNAAIIILDFEVNLHFSQVILPLCIVIFTKKSENLPTCSNNSTFEKGILPYA